MTPYPYVELPIRYPGHPKLRFIEGIKDNGQLNRIWLKNRFFHRRKGIGDIQQFEIHQLPLVNAIYEIIEVIDSRDACRYIAVLEDTAHIYRLTRDLVEAVAEGALTLRQAVARCEEPEDDTE